LDYATIIFINIVINRASRQANIGLSADDLTPLFRSAERYLEVWEKASAQAAALPAPASSSATRPGGSSRPGLRTTDARLSFWYRGSPRYLPSASRLECVSCWIRWLRLSSSRRARFAQRRLCSGLKSW